VRSRLTVPIKIAGLGFGIGSGSMCRRRGRLMPKNGERVLLEESGELGMWRVCQDCGDMKKQKYKSPPYPQRCKKCNIAWAAGTLGPLTIPEHDMLKQVR